MSETVHRTDLEPIVVQGHPPTAEEAALHGDYLKTREQTVPTLNDYLTKLVTLDTALIGGGFLIAKGDVLPYWCGFAVLVALVVSLGCAIYGLSPTMDFPKFYAVGGLDRYRNYLARVILKKNRAMVFASGCLVLAFLIGLGGLAARGKPEDPKPTKIELQRPVKQ